MNDDRLPRRRMLTTVGLVSALAGCAGWTSPFGDESSEDNEPDVDSTDGSRTDDDSADDSRSDDDSTETRDSPEQPLRITDFSLDTTLAQQTDIVTLSLAVANDTEDTIEANFVFSMGDTEIHSRSESIPSEDTIMVTTQRELRRIGEHQFQATIAQDGEPVANAQTSVSVGQFPSSFVGVEGTDFTLDDGTFYVSGADANSSYTVGVSHPHHDQLRPLMFDGLERIGATVYRLFVSTAPIERGGPFPGEDNEKFFRRFDMAITEAKRRNIRVSIPITSGTPHYDRHPVENLENTVPGYVHRAETADEINDFYRNKECIDLYKQWVEELLTHENHLTGVEYRHDPTIMMWELGNEVAWEEAWTRDSDSLRPWIEEVGPYVKQLAPDQLLTTGVHGWPDGRNDFLDDHRPDCIDICSMHYWVGPGHYDLPESEAEAVLDEKIKEAHETLEKPLWFSEYNWGHPDHPDSPGELSDAFQEERNSKLRKWHNRLNEADVAGAAVHQVNPKEVVEELIETTRGSTTIYPFEDTGTVEELRRYARITREKSTSTAVPELTDIEK